jgi:hypothetical protein
MDKLEQYLKSQIPLLKSLKEKINSIAFTNNNKINKDNISKAVKLTTKSLEIVLPLYKYLHPKDNNWELIINNIKQNKYSPISRELYLTSKTDSINYFLFAALYNVSSTFEEEEIKADFKLPKSGESPSMEGTSFNLSHLMDVIPNILKALNKFFLITPDIKRKRDLGSKKDISNYIDTTNLKIYTKIHKAILHDMQQIAKKEKFSTFDSDEYSKNEEFVKLKKAYNEIHKAKNENDIIEILKRYEIYNKYFPFLNLNEQYLRMQFLSGIITENKYKTILKNL